VWEIVAQREPHTDVDPVDVGALIRCVFPSSFKLCFECKMEREVDKNEKGTLVDILN
jgi:hypothetical protein